MERLERFASSVSVHIAVEERVLGPAFRSRISCASAWQLMNETIEEHRDLTRQLDLLLNSSSLLGKGRPLDTFSRRLKRHFQDQESRLFDEVRRHLGCAERSELAREMDHGREIDRE